MDTYSTSRKRELEVKALEKSDAGKTKQRTEIGWGGDFDFCNMSANSRQKKSKQAKAT